MPYFATDLGNNNKSVQAQKMSNEYSTRSNFLESVAVDSLMKTRPDKMVVIRMESRQRRENEIRERLSQKAKAGYMKRIKETLVLRRKEIF